MAQLTHGSVEILSRDDGSLLSQASSGTSKTLLLNQPSVVKIHGTRELVAEYERQGSDLILHMKDGTTVRYQQFFFDDVDGEHSELVFDDGINPPEHALFPVTSELVDTQTAMALTPEYESLGSIDPLLLADTGANTGVMTAAGIGALGLVGVGVGALAGGGGGGGGAPDNGGGTSPSPAAPTLTLGNFAGDNILDGAEKQSSQLLSGTTTNVEAGQIVTITLNGVTYRAPVQADGSWSVTVPASALQALADGTATFSATVTNSSGQTATDTHSVTVEPDSDSPGGGSLSITTPVSGDGYLNATEAQNSLTISGSASGLPAGTAISVTLGGQAYTTTTAANGSWSIRVPSADLQSLPQGSNLIVATATLTNGSTLQNSTQVTLDVQTSLPNAAIELPFGDGVLSGAEAANSQVITGNTGMSGPGQARPSVSPSMAIPIPVR